MVDINLTPATVNVAGIRAGDRNLFSLTIQATGRPMDMTGYTVQAQARTAVGAVEALDAVCSIDDPLTGKVTVRWPGEDVETWLAGQPTQKGVWDLQLTDDTGTDPWTVISGTFAAEMDITRA